MRKLTEEWAARSRVEVSWQGSAQGRWCSGRGCGRGDRSCSCGSIFRYSCQAWVLGALCRWPCPPQAWGCPHVCKAHQVLQRHLIRCIHIGKPFSALGAVLLVYGGSPGFEIFTLGTAAPFCSCLCILALLFNEEAEPATGCFVFT